MIIRDEIGFYRCPSVTGIGVAWGTGGSTIQSSGTPSPKMQRHWFWMNTAGIRIY